MGRGVGVHNHDQSAPVAITRWQDKGNAVAEALDLCGALDGFDPGMRVIIKPNLVEWITKYDFSPYGIVTTAVVMEALIAYLKDAGAKDITIAEAALENKEFGCGTKTAFENLNYAALAGKYGVKLMDLNDEEFVKVPLGGFSLSLSKPILDADFLINVPVLKTHEQTKVTLGFKNNKGCINAKSKSICHHRKRPLDAFVARLGARLYPHLTLIDGIYSLEYGPMHMGAAHRENLIIASRDMLNCDTVGSALMGFEPSDVSHLREFAEENGRTQEMDKIEIRGLDWSENVHKINHIDPTDPWHKGSEIPAFFEKAGVKGFRLPHPGQTLCTGCSMLFPVSVLLIIAGAVMSGGEPYDNYELLGGKTVKPSGNANKTFLLGDCIIAANRKEEGIKQAVPIPGCPANLDSLVETMNANGVMGTLDVVSYYFHKKYKSYGKKPELFQMEHFSIT